VFEKVNQSHPDKLCDRVAGALVDLAYKKQNDPRIAVEVLLGHGVCHIIAETSVALDKGDVGRAVRRIAGDVMLDYREVPQDARLAGNQDGAFRCGDNGIFKGTLVTHEQRALSDLMKALYEEFPHDGKAVLSGGTLTVCQSNAEEGELAATVGMLADEAGIGEITLNPLGFWTGGPDVDTGATNRKLGSDMGDGVTGGGLHGKDLSKADVSVNVYAHLKAQETGKPVELCCAIGDEEIDGRPYPEIVEIAREYIQGVGGFEKFAEWGLV
jgi:S-adenosylmethionine synthetase